MEFPWSGVSNFDLAWLGGFVVVAGMLLVRLMHRRRSEVLRELRREVRAELARKALAEQIAAVKAGAPGGSPAAGAPPPNRARAA